MFEYILSHKVHISNSYIINGNAQTLGTILKINMIHRNSLRFTKCKVINTKNSKIQNTATITVTHPVMLLLLRRPFRDVKHSAHSRRLRNG